MSSMTKPLFIIGNKRSGTTQLVKLLNLHPQIFVSHESDIIWILYQFYNDLPFRAYPQDSDKGMRDALKRCGHLLDRAKNPAENYFTFQRRLMETGSSWLPPMDKKDVLWIGDKKPFQNADASLTEFILSHFDEAHFIHLIRHPFSVALSTEDSNKTPDGDFWQDMSLEEMVRKWTENEVNVAHLKNGGRARVMDVVYEDLRRETGKELSRIFRFLNLGADNAVLRTAERITYYKSKDYPKIPCSPQTLSIMKQYGYEAEGIQKPKIMHLADNARMWLKKRVSLLTMR